MPCGAGRGARCGEEVFQAQGGDPFGPPAVERGEKLPVTFVEAYHGAAVAQHHAFRAGIEPAQEPRFERAAVGVGVFEEFALDVVAESDRVHLGEAFRDAAADRTESRAVEEYAVGACGAHERGDFSKRACRHSVGATRQRVGCLAEQRGAPVDFVYGEPLAEQLREDASVEVRHQLAAAPFFCVVGVGDVETGGWLVHAVCGIRSPGSP